jgi:hypothetical protein
MYSRHLSHIGFDVRALDVPTCDSSIEQRLVQTLDMWVGQLQCLLNQKYSMKLGSK